MPIELGRRLIASGVVPPEEVEAALFLAVVRGVPMARALIDRGAITERALDDELGRRGGLALRNVVGAADLVARLPRAMCRRLAAVPTRLDPATGVADVAAADPLDPHVASEFGYHLDAPIRVIRAPIGAIEEAIRRIELSGAAGASAAPRHRRERRATPAFPHGAPDSSIPPPPTDELPIPLVRRLGVPLIDPDEADRPLTVRPTGSGEWEAVRAAFRQPSLPAQSVRFPSSPPPPDRLAEPYDGASVVRDGYAIPARRRTARPPPVLRPLEPVEEPPRPPFASPEAIFKAIREAAGRDEIVSGALRGLRQVARRVGVFVIKRDGFHGWACNVSFGDVDALRTIVIPHDVPSVLATAAAASVYLGPIPNTKGHAGLLAVMSTASRDVAFVAVRAGGRPAMILVADDLGDPLMSTRRMTELADAAGEALSRLLTLRL